MDRGLVESQEISHSQHSKERYLEVCEVGSDLAITVIEGLLPKNKRLGKGRTSYEEKRLKILSSLIHIQKNSS
ncbi:MAG: DUF4058 family protein [Leptolyngbyaceae cyanobacterium MAG.088]|nr:DUF4058 family protein [Leptolyngbyaceae cyanobacterium MAG.088]